MKESKQVKGKGSHKASCRNFSYFTVPVKPIVFAAGLEGGKYYVSINRNLNETLCKYTSNFGPIYTRLYQFLKIREIDHEGSFESLKRMTISFIKLYGKENVRSSIKGHSRECDQEPWFLIELSESNDSDASVEK